MKRTIYLLLALLLLIGVVSPLAMAENAAPELSIAYCNISFRDSVCIKYAVRTDVADVKILIWNSPRTEYSVGTHDSEITEYYTENISGVPHKIFDYTALSAKQMGDVVYACAYAQIDGVDCYSEINKYSILQYAYNKLGKTATASTDTELKEMLTNMLEYGASAQRYFDYKEDRLVTADWVQVKVTEGLLEDGSTGGLYLPGDTVTLKTPEVDEQGAVFSHWEDSNGNQITTAATYELTVGTVNEVYTPVYKQPEHTVVIDEAVAPSCSETGLTEGSHCSVCGTVLVKQEIIAATGEHIFGEWITVKEATTTQEGSMERSCECGEKETKTIAKILASEGLAFTSNSDGTCYVSGMGTCTDEHIIIPTTSTEGEAVIGIGGEAFYNTNIRSVCIPDSVKYIDGLAFAYNYSLYYVYIGSGVERISSDAFMGCISPSFTVSEDNATYYSAEGCVIRRDNNVLIAGSNVIPDGVTGIADFALSGRYSVVNITIPSSVVEISSEAFYQCDMLTQITLSDGFTHIGYRVFASLYSLERVVIPNSVTAIDDFAFSGSKSLQEIIFDGTVAQWNAISKGMYWADYTGDFIVYCTDGEISKDS